MHELFNAYLLIFPFILRTIRASVAINMLSQITQISQIFKMTWLCNYAVLNFIVDKIFAP
jgi:hypothetical protein